MQQPRKVISVGNDAELMWLRDAVLRNAGFDVASILDVKEGFAAIERGHCDVLLLCYSLPLLTRRQLAEIFRASCPDGRVVTITNEKSDPEFADVVVYGIDGPEALIEAIHRARSVAS
jgi:DNA-binding NarL/FixJ family response regulator